MQRPVRVYSSDKPGTVKVPFHNVPPALAEDWTNLKVLPDDSVGCVICGVGGEDIVIGDTPKEDVIWRCQGCNGLVCRNHTLCMPDARDHRPHYRGREYYHETMCSLQCWERLGKPDE